MTKHLIAVVGPTGSGKTALAVKLAKKFNGVLISADSRQVYRGLNVGTNKEGQAGEWHGQPARLVDGVPQLMVDCVNPGDRFTLQDWLNQTRYMLEHIWKDGCLPIVVGGTGLYVSALVEGYQPGTGRHAKLKQIVDFQALILGLDLAREELYERSDRRIEELFAQVVDETKQLLKSGVSASWLERIGLDYRFTSLYLSQQLDRDSAIKQNQLATRHYIRRQLTWWRHHGPPVPVADLAAAEKETSQFLTN